MAGTPLLPKVPPTSGRPEQERLQRQIRDSAAVPRKRVTLAGTQYETVADGGVRFDVTFATGYSVDSVQTVTLPRAMARVPIRVTIASAPTLLSGGGGVAVEIQERDKTLWTRTTIRVSSNCAAVRVPVMVS